MYVRQSNWEISMHNEAIGLSCSILSLCLPKEVCNEHLSSNIALIRMCSLQPRDRIRRRPWMVLLILCRGLQRHAGGRGPRHFHLTDHALLLISPFMTHVQPFNCESATESANELSRQQTAQKLVHARMCSLRF